MARIIAVVSGKGGTGKSTVAASLSVSLTSLGCSVLAVDLDVGLRSLDILLSLENKLVFDIGDILEGRCDIEHALVSHERYSRLKLLCAPPDASKTFSVPHVIDLIRGAAKGFDYVILDLPAGVGLSVIMARALADLVTVVTVPDLITLRDARKTVDVLLSNCRKPCRLIINKVCRENILAGGVKDLDEVLDIVGIPLLAVIPDDPFINQTAKSQKKRERRAPFTQHVIDAAAHRIVGEYVPLLLTTV